MCVFDTNLNVGHKIPKIQTKFEVRCKIEKPLPITHKAMTTATVYIHYDEQCMDRMHYENNYLKADGPCITMTSLEKK